MSFRRQTLQSMDTNRDVLPLHGTPQAQGDTGSLKAQRIPQPGEPSPGPGVRSSVRSSTAGARARPSVLPRAAASQPTPTRDDAVPQTPRRLPLAQPSTRREANAAAPGSRRTSLAPVGTPSAANRSTSSMHGRASLAPVGRESMMLGSSSQSAPREPRPIKNKSFQEQMGTLVIAALGENHVAGGQSIRKAVREPTQLAFIDMFQTLWRSLIDPYQVFESSAGTTPAQGTSSTLASAGHGTNMSKAVDEILMLLREVGYPHLEDMTKSRLMAAGGVSNWPYCLAMLGWIVRIGDVLNDQDRIPVGPEQRVEAKERSGPDASPNQTETSNMDYFYAYLWKTYEKFWKGQDDFPEEREWLEDIFDARDQQVLQDLQELRQATRELGHELTILHNNPSPKQEATTRYNLLVSDIKKFQDYYKHHILRKVDTTTEQIKTFKQTEEEVQANIKALEAERDQLQAQVDAQPMTYEEYDLKEKQRAVGQEQLARHYEQRDKAVARLNGIEMEFFRVNSEVENLLKDFNMLGKTIDVLPVAVPRHAFNTLVDADDSDGPIDVVELIAERGELMPPVDVEGFLLPLIKQRERETAGQRQLFSERKLLVGQKYDELLDEVQRAQEKSSELHKTLEATRAEIEKINTTSRDESAMADQVEQDHNAAQQQTLDDGHAAVTEQMTREAHLRFQLDRASVQSKEHIAALSNELAAAMSRILNLKDHVSDGIRKMLDATKANSSSTTEM